MIRSAEKLQKLDADYQRERLRSLTYERALVIFAGLWDHARLVNPKVGSDWESDLAADITLARVLNGLPVSS